MDKRMERAAGAFISTAFYVVTDDGDFTILYANRHFYELLERTEEEVKGKYGSRLSALLNPDDLRNFRDRLKNSAEAYGRLRFRKKDGSYAYTDTSAANTGNGRLFCISWDVTEYEKKISEIKELEYKLGLVMARTGCVTFEYYPMKKKALYCVRTGTNSTTEFAAENFPDSLILSGTVHPDSARDFAGAVNDMAMGAASFSCEIKMKMPGREEYGWYILSMEKNVREGTPRITGLMEDITGRKEAVLAYLRETKCYQAMLSDTEAWGDADIDENRINKAGGLWSVYNGPANAMTYDGIIENFAKKTVHPADRKHYTAVAERENLISSHKNGISKLGCEFRCVMPQNKLVWMRLTVHIFYDPANGHLSASMHLNDIDREKKKELRLQKESRRDPLTDFYNRRMTEASVKEYLANWDKKAPCAFIILDIDDFKDINDSYGHAAGDRVLRKFASILKNFFGRDDIIGRFGGDEFIVFIKNAGSERAVKERLESVINAMKESGGIPVSCSIGAAMGPQCGTDYEKLFHCADSAMYQAKKNDGKASFVFYGVSEIPGPAEARAEGERETFREKISENEKTEPVSESGESVSDSLSLDGLLNAEGDMAYIIDADTYELLEGNRAFYGRLGISESDLRGVKCYEALHGRNAPCPFCSKLNWSEEKFYLWKNYNLLLEREFLIKNKLMRRRGKTAVLAVLIDISGGGNIADLADGGINAESVLLNCVYKITAADSLEAALNTALEAAAHFYGAEKAQLWEKSMPDGEFVLSCEYSKDTDAALPVSYERTVSRFLGEISGGGIWADTPEDMLRLSFDMYKLMKSMGISNYRVSPLADREETYGCVVVENTRARSRHASFIESLCLFIVKEIQKYRREGTIEYMRRHDALTGLPNRISYEEYTGSFNGDRLSSVGVLAANINELGKTNNSMGYDAGNSVISEMAFTLRKIFGDYKIFRPSGDEFIVAAENISRESFEEKALILKNAIDRSDKLSAAVGYVWDDEEKNLGLLIWHSYELMKMNKRLYYDSGSGGDADPARYEMLSGLLSSIENGDFLVYLQPKKDILENRITGAEALARYRENDGTISPPAKFIGRLEEKGLIRYVDFFVFEEVCRILERRKKEGRPDLKISVNFSRITLFESETPALMEAIADKYDADRKNIEIEITESVSEMGKNVLCRIVRDIKNAGFSVSLDDFGTKYTNLSTLADILFDVLKLDKSLINTLTDSATNRIIVKNVITMCRELGAEVIAEGVETKEQEKILTDLGCRYVQGYLYGKPMPENEFEKTESKG